MLCYSRVSINSNFLPKALDLYIYGSGVKWHVLSVLSGYGICPSYGTLARDMEYISDIAKERMSQALSSPTITDDSKDEVM